MTYPNRTILRGGRVYHLKDKCVTVDIPKADNTLLYILIAMGILLLLKD